MTSNSKPAECFSNEEQLSGDLEFLIMMFLLRNNHISKIISKSLTGLDSILEMLKEKYDINDETRKSGTALVNEIIPLPDNPPITSRSNLTFKINIKEISMDNLKNTIENIEYLERKPELVNNPSNANT